MRRPIVVLLLLIIGVTALAQVQSREVAEAAERIESAPVIPEDDLPPVMIDDEWLPFELERVEYEDLPEHLLSGADLCVDAFPLMYEDGTVGGGDVQVTNFMTTDASDPDISACMYGSPSNVQGYRSVWYRFFPFQSGVVNIKTTFDPSNYETSYDTVVALHRSDDFEGDCDLLQLIACNDDAQGFQSEIEVFVRQWAMYYIEVVDWNFAVNNNAMLRLSLAFEPGESLWDEQEQAYQTWEKPRSRHEVVAYSDGAGNDYLLVIAGQTAVGGTPTRDGRVDRYHVQSGTWKELLPMEGQGYSNTTAALVDGKIYMPAGYVGNNSAYDGRHFVFDPNAGEYGAWTFAAEAPWDELDGQPFAWSQAVPTATGSGNTVPGYFLTGGVLPEGNNATAWPVNHLLLYTPSTDQWNINFPKMATARYNHVAAGFVVDRGNNVVDRLTCVAGGITRGVDLSYRSLRDAECFNLRTGTWNPIAPMAFNRFNGGSAVGPDGRWYVFGGSTVIEIEGESETVPLTVTEVYDPVRNSWEILDSRYDLREPARSWPRGDFVNDTLWVFGGETFNIATSTWGVVPLIESLYIPPNNGMLPTVLGYRAEGNEPNDTIQTATPIAMNAPHYDTFLVFDDFHDFFSFEVPYTMAVRASLTDIPLGNDYNVYLYDADKFLVGSSTNVGNNDENALSFPLLPGIYYVLVQRVTTFVHQSPYRLLVTPR